MITSGFLEAIIGVNPDLDEELVRRALVFAEDAHEGQVAVETAKTLAEWRMDTASVVAGILHDTVEKGAAKATDIEEEFGPEIAFLVSGVTKLDCLHLGQGCQEEFVENLRKMFVAMARDLRVVVIKLADRLHDMRALEYLGSEEQQLIAKETLDVFAPLADRLQMGQAKAELEDLAFKYFRPEDYGRISKLVQVKWKKAEEILENERKKLLFALREAGVKAKVFHRRKHLYSLFRKLQRDYIQDDIDRIYDFLAFRVLVETIDECYRVMGAVNKNFRAVDQQIRDYVVHPKGNGYRSIHMNVQAVGGLVFEIQIRTYEMHEQAEFGIAAHWYYAGLKAKGVSNTELEAGKFAPSEKLVWVRQLAEWHNEVKDNKTFYAGLREDYLAERIFVLTPKGDVFDLPSGATPVDFAFAVHTDLGARVAGAKVNGKMVGLDCRLKSGDVCEIMLTKERRRPSSDWLGFVKTRLARREIHKMVDP